MTDVNCVLRHREPRSATRGYLCAGHHRWLNTALDDVLITSALLPGFLQPGSVDRDPSLPVTRRGIDPPAPIRLEVVALADVRTGAVVHDGDVLPVLAILESWARLVREERRLDQPRTPATIMGEAGLLNRNADWIAEQAWVEEFAAELRTTLAALHAAIGDYAPRPVGRCAALTDSGSECGGPLLQDRYGAFAVSCRRCGDRWDEHELRRLGMVLESDPRHAAGTA